ncbi:hypothetical protein L596_023390 [Steinernema carpocapsae]|uniref:Uncharacterized protein n=1 Tax=Steinernema carpocapsae TaxID=34508 RepID=A0A4U5MDJ8_STECR|nr:hypothetical protein L596_023390 [Steinernema carpocapsae]
MMGIPEYHWCPNPNFFDSSKLTAHFPFSRGFPSFCHMILGNSQRYFCLLKFHREDQTPSGASGVLVGPRFPNPNLPELPGEKNYYLPMILPRLLAVCDQRISAQKRLSNLQVPAGAHLDQGIHRNTQKVPRETHEQPRNLVRRPLRRPPNAILWFLYVYAYKPLENGKCAVSVEESKKFGFGHQWYSGMPIIQSCCLPFDFYNKCIAFMRNYE